MLRPGCGGEENVSHKERERDSGDSYLPLACVSLCVRDLPLQHWCGAISHASKASLCGETEVHCAFRCSSVGHCDQESISFSSRVWPPFLLVHLLSDTTVSFSEQDIFHGFATHG